MAAGGVLKLLNSFYSQLLLASLCVGQNGPSADPCLNQTVWVSGCRPIVPAVNVLSFQGSRRITGENIIGCLTFTGLEYWNIFKLYS